MATKNETIKVERLTNCDKMMSAIITNLNVEIDDMDSLFNAKWVSVNDEMPEEEGVYFVMTNEGWAKGIATYLKDEDTDKSEFDVWWAASGKEPKVEYWLKYQEWPLTYLLKKRAGHFGKIKSK